MPSHPSKPISFDPAQVDRLACPACLGSLVLGKAKLVCQDCGRSYPIVDGIPVLIVERAADLRP